MKSTVEILAGFAHAPAPHRRTWNSVRGSATPPLHPSMQALSVASVYGEAVFDASSDGYD